MGSVTECQGLYCAILATTTYVLQNGLESLLQNGCSNKSLTSGQYCMLASSVVHYQATGILDSVELLLNQWRSTNSCLHVIDRSFVAISNSETFITNSTKLTFSDVKYGEHGRMLVASQGVSRGTVLLTEFPFMCCAQSGCDCSEGPVMVEHLVMATVLQKHNSDNPSQFITKFHERLFSGLVTDKFDKSIETVWDKHMTYYLSVCCAITALCHQSYCSNTATFSRLQLIDKKALQAEATGLLQILARIPPNLHAISKVVSSHRGEKNINDTVFSKSDKPYSRNSKNDMNNNKTTAMCNTLQQVRVGFGLYLTASSVNHSCKPNSAIRFTQHVNTTQADANYNALYTTGNVSLTAGDLEGERDDKNKMRQLALHTLVHSCVEIVTTDLSIAYDQEVTVSYGPMQGKHPVAVRRKCLREQYLFDCHCQACTSEINADEAYLLPNSLSGLSCSSDEKSGSGIYVKDIAQLCSRLNILGCEMKQINREFSTIMEHDSTGRKTDHQLKQFLRERLAPQHQQLTDLQHEYFPDSHADTMSTELRYSFSVYCGILCNCLDLQAHILALSNEYLAASQLIMQAIDLMVASGQYADDDVVVGRERVKLAQLQLSSGDLVASRVAAQKALSNLSPFVDKRQDPDWIEASNMLKFLDKTIAAPTKKASR